MGNTSCKETGSFHSKFPCGEIMWNTFMFGGAPKATSLRQRSSPLRIFILGDPPGLLEWQKAATELSEQEDRRGVCVCVVVVGCSC